MNCINDFLYLLSVITTSSLKNIPIQYPQILHFIHYFFFLYIPQISQYAHTYHENIVSIYSVLDCKGASGLDLSVQVRIFRV
jgi:hypothetical protein